MPAPSPTNPFSPISLIHSSGYFTNMPGHYMRRNNPMDYLVWLVVDGEGFLNTEGRQFRLKAGDLTLLRPGTRQEYGADPDNPWSIYWVHFDGSAARTLFEELRTLAGGPCTQIGIDPLIKERFEEIVLMHEAAGPGMHPRVDCELLALLSQVLQRLMRTQRPGADPRLDTRAVEAWIQKNLTGKLRLSDMAAQSSLSTAHFCRLFRAAYDMSPMAYVIRLRMVRACHLLRETNTKIAQIASATGYDDPYYFSRLFTRTVGVSPRQYRMGSAGYVALPHTVATREINLDANAQGISNRRPGPDTEQQTRCGKMGG